MRTIAADQELFILWLLATEGEIGRYRLARMLGKPQGVARGILDRLRSRGLVIVRRRAGATISKKGLRDLGSLFDGYGLKRVEKLEHELLGLGPANVVLQVARSSKQLSQGIEQRDAAIREGATGAVTFLFDGKMLRFPGVAEPVIKRSPAAFDQLKKHLRMRKGDVVVIAFGNTWWDAARGGFAAAQTLA